MKPYYEHGGITIYNGDCREILPSIPAADVTISDPPYSQHVHGKSRSGARLPDGTKGHAQISRATEFGFDAITEETRGLIAQWTKTAVARWALMFSDVESSHLWREAMTAQGLDYVRTGAWVKIGATPQFTGDRPAVGFEAVTICHQPGKKRWNGGGKHALWSYPIVLNRSHTDPRLHTTQKPLPLMAALVELFTDPNELVVDMFMGSGTTLRAAKDLGRRAIGIELQEKYCEAAALRLGQETLALT